MGPKGSPFGLPFGPILEYVIFTTPYVITNTIAVLIESNMERY
jgi:hypothetical protein